MSQFRLELNRAGVRELLKSSEMLDACENAGKQVANRAGSGYAVSSRIANRAVVHVAAETPQAWQDNLKNNTLVKALK